MARTSIYLNFPHHTEEAFAFYKEVFGTEYSDDIARFRDIPTQEGAPPIEEADLDLVMHVSLPILGGFQLMGSDAPESLGIQLFAGNNLHINLEPDTRSETDRLFNALSEGGTIEMPLQDMFWGAYYGSCRDRFGIQWMFNCTESLPD